jgi:sec-independent protein translocase protein TatA
MMLAFGMPGPWELAIIVIVIVALFGAKKIPELARSIGKAKGEFQKGLKEGAQDESGKKDAPQA